MEVLIEGLIEVFGEIFLEIIAALIGTFFDYLNENSKVKRIVKSTVAFIFYGGAIVLLTLSFIHHKKILLSLAIGYFIVTTIIYLLKFTNRNKWKSKKTNDVIKIIQHVLHYVFPVSLIVVGAITLNSTSAKVWLIISSSLAIIIRFCIDVYKLDRRSTRKSIYENNINPITHNMKVDLNTYNQILKDKRAPIICINTFERQKINYGDFINIYNDYNKAEIKVKVVNKETYKTVEKLYKAKRFEIPYKTLNELRSYLTSNFYSDIDIKKHGLLYLMVFLQTKED